MSLSALELARYKRHLLLRDVGGQGQQKLKAARVLVIGAGGLGSPVLAYLAAAGVGTLGIIDDDHVSLDNLQRQIIHKTASVGMPKVLSAKAAIAEMNPHVSVETFEERLTAANAMERISAFDIIVDGSDNFSTRYLVNDACYFAKKPLAFAALGPFDGMLTVFKAFACDAAGEPQPNYRCLFPEAPPVGTVQTCAEAGILGAVAGVVGVLQAVEVLKLICKIGEPLLGRLLIYDAQTPSFETLRYRWDPDNPLNGRSPSILGLAVHSKHPADLVETFVATT